MKKISFMVGTWNGDGWADAQGQHHAFRGTEIILPKCEGAIMSLEGNHYIDAGGRQIPIHNAFGFIRFDDRTGRYYMRSHLANGLEMEFDFTPNETGYTWKMPHPVYGEVLYTATFKGDDWMEYGDAMKDGKPVRIYEMHMKRQSG